MAGYQSDTTQNGSSPTTLLNTNELLPIAENRRSDTIRMRSNEGSIQVINQNMISNYNAKIIRVGGIGNLENAILKMPIPNVGDAKDSISGLMVTELGTTITYRLNAETGILQLSGEITQRLDAIIFQFQPYIAKFPLEYDPRTIQQIINDL